MTMQLYIEYGSTHLDFQDDGYFLLDGFYPETPDAGATSISDRFNLSIRGASSVDLEAKIRAIELAFEHARRHTNDAQAAYIYFSVDDGDPWRSLLLGGTVMLDSSLGRRWLENKAKVAIALERAPYWDGPETQILLSNGNGTDDVAGLTVYNHDDADAGHDNYVEIAAASVAGDLPGPTRLEVVNTYASGRLYTLWIGQNWTDPDNLAHIIEAEASSTGTILSGSTYSGGSAMRYSLPSGVETTLFTWSLTSAFLNACKGSFYKILARFCTTAPTNVRLRLKLQYNLTTIWQSGQVAPDPTRSLLIRDLFTLRLPPWLPGQTDLNAITMLLTGQQSTGSAINVDLDFLQITPLDGWRMLECLGYGIVQNNRLVDDGINGSFYIDDGAGANKIGILVGYGNPIVLYPGKKQRLYFLMHNWLGDSAEIARTASVKLFYRPRRRTL